MKQLNFIVSCFFLSTLWQSVVWAGQYSGTVVDQLHIPVNGAIVRLQGTKIFGVIFFKT